MYKKCNDFWDARVQHPTVLDLNQLVAGGFWAVILSRAAWKKSWAGRDPTHSIIPADRSVAITGDTARAQLLTA